MPDVEKVIKGLKYLHDVKRWSPNESEESITARRNITGDALALLKAQEPVEPTIGGDADGPCRTWWYQCGKCKEAIDYHDKYCRNCGQAVKWE